MTRMNDPGPSTAGLIATARRWIRQRGWIALVLLLVTAAIKLLILALALWLWNPLG